MFFFFEALATEAREYGTIDVQVDQKRIGETWYGIEERKQRQT